MEKTKKKSPSQLRRDRIRHSAYLERRHQAVAAKPATPTPPCKEATIAGTEEVKVEEENRDAKIQYIYTSAFLRIQKFTPKMRDSRQSQHYQKCVIYDISLLKRLKNSVKHQETVKNAKKQCETVTDGDTFGFQLLSQTLDI